MDHSKIGKFISALRKEQGLTQRAFADMLGISDKTVSKWERGGGMPELSLMPPLCAALGIDLNELFSGERLNDANYKAKAEENMRTLLQEAEKMKANIVGGRVLGEARTIELDASAVHKTNNAFWSTVGGEVLGVTALPSYGGFMTEEKSHLLGDLTGKKVLELACGNGRSLQYVHDLGAAELWGVDISQEQLNRTRTFLSAQNISARLICSPMETACGIPENYFDVVYSIFGIGWTTGLDETFRLIHTYLKPGGTFLFNWSHPIHKCTSFENGKLVFRNSYYDERWYAAEIGGREVMLSNRMLSTYLNALAAAGFLLERLLEKGDEELQEADGGTFGAKAGIVPVGFVIKAKKMVY